MAEQAKPEGDKDFVGQVLDDLAEKIFLRHVGVGIFEDPRVPEQEEKIRKVWERSYQLAIIGLAYREKLRSNGYNLQSPALIEKRRPGTVQHGGDKKMVGSSRPTSEEEMG